jgi:hypothetical protein
MGFWSIIVPETTTNLVTNPSLETNITGWTNVAGCVLSQATTGTAFGAYSLQSVFGGAANDRFYYEVTGETAANTEYTLSVWITGASGGEVVGILLSDDVTGYQHYGNITCPTTPTQYTPTQYTWTATYGAASTVRWVGGRIPGATAATVRFDGWQLEQKAYATTYCDGTQTGCEWNGTEHASTSTRSALSRAGGRVYDLTDQYNFYVTNVIDSGIAPLTQHLDEYAIIDGGEISSYKVHPRVLTLMGHMQSQTSYSALHDDIQDLIDIIKPDAVPNNQPILLRYTEATVTKEIAVRYEGGLGENWQARWCAQQNIPLRFIAADPYWYEVGESGAVLDTNDTATLYYLAGRLRADGQWGNLGLSAIPTANGPIETVMVAKQSDGSVYFGGLFDGIDNNTPAGGDYVIRYDPQDGSLNLLVGASDVNGRVDVISEGPDGIIYLGGAFTAVNGVATADYIVSYDPVADTWASLSDPDNGGLMNTVFAMDWDSLGNLYIGGSFTGVDGVANTAYFAMWDGAAWNAVGGGGGTGIVRAIAIDKDDNIYIGGNFLNWDGDANADYWAWYSSSAAAWSAVNDIALVASVSVMEYDSSDNSVYVGGAFDNAGSVANADNIFKWTGTAVEALSTGTDDDVYAIKVAPDGLLWVSGAFTQAGSLTGLDRFAMWNGAVWLPPDIDFPGSLNLDDFDFSKPDPVVDSIYDVYVGFSTTGTGYFSGSATITNSGSAQAYPVIAIKRSGGTSARLQNIRNEDTGKTLFFAYDLLDGETLTIDLDPQRRSIVSSFFGVRLDAALTGSDLVSFVLQPGSNQITAFVSVVGAPTITATVIYSDKYWSLD